MVEIFEKFVFPVSVVIALGWFIGTRVWPHFVKQSDDAQKLIVKQSDHNMRTQESFITALDAIRRTFEAHNSVMTDRMDTIIHELRVSKKSSTKKAQGQ